MTLIPGDIFKMTGLIGQLYVFVRTCLVDIGRNATRLASSIIRAGKATKLPQTSFVPYSFLVYYSQHAQN